MAKRGDSGGDDGGCAGVALSTTLPGGSMRGSEARVFLKVVELDVRNSLVNLKTLNIVRAKYLRELIQIEESEGKENE